MFKEFRDKLAESIRRQATGQEPVEVQTPALPQMPQQRLSAQFVPFPRQQTPGSAPDLGALSAKYESSGDPGAIGYDRTGGWSFGTHQLTKNSLMQFVQSNPLTQSLKGLLPSSAAFQAKWKEIAQKYGPQFAQLQKSFIESTHFKPQAQRLAQSGFDVTKRSPTLQSVIYSTSVQHGPNNDVVQKALKKVGKNASDEQLIRAIFAERWSGGKRFASSTPAVRKAVYNRFFGKGGELETALAQFRK